MHYKITSLLTASTLLCASTALAQSKEDSESTYKEAFALTKESPPKFVPETPWITANMRLGAGLGVFTLEGDGGSSPSLSGGMLSLSASAGDEFWDVLGYYLGIRANFLALQSIEANGQSFDNYNEQSIEWYEAAGGVELWVVPQFVGVSAEAVAGISTMSLLPVRRADYTLTNELLFTGGRARASLRFGEYALNGEYFVMLPTSDQNGEIWEGWNAAVSLSYHPL